MNPNDIKKLALTFIILWVLVPISGIISDLIAQGAGFWWNFLPWPVFFALAVVGVNHDKLRTKRKSIAYLVLPLATVVLFYLCMWIYLAGDQGVIIDNDPRSDEERAADSQKETLFIYMAYAVAGLMPPIIYWFFFRFKSLLLAIVICTVASVSVPLLGATSPGLIGIKTIIYLFLAHFRLSEFTQILAPWQILVGLAITVSVRWTKAPISNDSEMI